ncbi:BREX-5 system adenine-specific DNA-methyltransferase PglX [Haloarcula marismortui]|uniref:site-specific DNA-methyltransferase (adenine-specific) n=1 Tax=Haloarcula marismortui ATCC 33799 TaxID=662475 RepID=M0JP67_9EURY|nr:BREX-5 system adenine-specific DNA-methyltransferase PglX [Haloarcula californiae]EMA09769.1 hypothetical protein C435_21165 [Haloarcula californiae ATCC 33799]
MESDSLSQRKAQLDKEEREYLEDVVIEMRERVEDNVEFQLTQKGLDDEPEDADSLDEETKHLVEAIELEAVDGETWSEAFNQYVTGVGYTIVNRLAALRCMEVRDFINEEVTVFKDNGLTPAAETLVHEEFLLEDEAILEAYHNACDDFAEEIEILFDRSSPYSLIDPDDDTFEELCGMLDSVEDDVWRGDDVLGWVYEYYNVSELSDIRTRAHRGEMTIEDVSVANQFYTPHWIVRMLTDNSLGKMYLESQDPVPELPSGDGGVSPEERKDRSQERVASDSVAGYCTYLAGGSESRGTEEIEPAELKVIDPACGSGHFLLYAFDVLERIWWEQRPDLDRAEIPELILENNLFGVDIDLRAAQLAAFNLYLKARSRAEEEGIDAFTLPSVGIVCADSKITDVEEATSVFDEVADERPQVREALEQLVTEFENIHGLGSLLNVHQALSENFLEPGSEQQLTLSADWDDDPTLSGFLSTLHDAIEEEKDDGSFLAQDLKSFLRLLQILTQEYDVALMNPPYGSGKRMPDPVQDYVKENYDYYPEYYINFFEVCERLTGDDGRIGMIVPRTFMFKRSFEDFRNDFLGGKGAFDFLAEFGNGVLDNATVRTVGTVVRTESDPNATGQFIRLHDVPAGEKEGTFLKVISSVYGGDVQRVFEINHEDFSKIPGNPICYYTHPEIRDLHSSNVKINPEKSGIDAEGVADVVQGLATGNNERFLRNHYEVSSDDDFIPYAKGGTDAYVLPESKRRIFWDNGGKQIERHPGSRFQNTEYYGREGLTWSYIKETGRRFGYFPGGGTFDVTGSMLFPRDDSMGWEMLAALNSDLYHGLFLSLTPERDWQIEIVSRIPWLNIFEDDDLIAKTVKDQYRLSIAEESYDPASPYFAGPELLPLVDDCEFFYDDRPAMISLDGPGAIREDTADKSASIREIGEEVKRTRLVRSNEIERLADEINETVFDVIGVSDEARESVLEEIRLRTKEDPKSRELADTENVELSDEDLRSKVEGLLHYCLLSAVRDQGVIPFHEGYDDYPSAVEAVEDQMAAYFGEYTEERLSEIDSLLGSRSPVEEPYPNVRNWIETEFFEFHTEQFDNRPIVWQIDTTTLTSGDGRGFACLVDYDAIDGSLFDKIQSRLVEPRKARLRERRNAAERQRNDESATATERAEATEEYERCVNSMQQIEIFEETIQDLMRESPRSWTSEDRQLADDLTTLVSSFRRRTQEYLDTLDNLQELKDETWFEDTFSPTFLKTVSENRDEWTDALNDLETAAEAYKSPAAEPVEPHHYDLFPYFSDIAGSDHYSSNGILFTTYYFEREGEQFLDEAGRPKEGLRNDEAELLSALAEGLDEYKQLAEEIESKCNSLSKRISSDWDDRALSEITTAGYQPNHKHGVKINITPLSDAEIVPKIVDDEVL